MKSRLIASLAVGAAVVVGTTGCSMITPVSTTVPYSPSDGIDVADSSGPVQVRNVLIVSTEDGSSGNLIAAIVNDTDDAETLHMDAGVAGTATVRVPARTTLSLGADEEPLLIEDLDTMPGATIGITFQSGDATGVTTDVPVLTDELGYLEGLAPTPTATPASE